MMLVPMIIVALSPDVSLPIYLLLVLLQIIVMMPLVIKNKVVLSLIPLIDVTMTINVIPIPAITAVVVSLPLSIVMTTMLVLKTPVKPIKVVFILLSKIRMKTIVLNSTAMMRRVYTILL
jgi:hypothetical protein